MTGRETDRDAAGAESGHALDADRDEKLTAYLATALDATVTGTEVLGDGLNLNVAISTAESGWAYVLRRPNKLRDAYYMNGVAEEYGVLERLADTPIPAPTPVPLCDDESVLGSRFLVTTYLDGVVVPLGSDLPARFRNADSRRRLAHGLVDTLADVHSLDVDRFEGVCDRRPPREQVARTAERLEAATSATGHEVPTLRSVGEWLREHAPAETETRLVHGDYRPANVLFADDEGPRISGVLDWETALLGDPLTDLGYLLLRWRDAGDPTPSLSGIAERHGDADETLAYLEAVNDEGLAPFTARPGSPSRRELVARYESETDRSFENERFYRALAAFSLATVWADLYRWYVEAGDGSDPAASDWEPRIEYVGLLAESIVSGELGL